MKKKTSLLWGFAAVLLIIACQNTGSNSSNANNNSQETVADDTIAIKSFKTEYERGNGTKSKSGKTHISVTVENDSNIIYATEEDILKIENGIVLFAFPTCPWARNIVEPLLDFAKEENVKIYYLNNSKIRDKKELQQDSTTVVTTEEGTQGYYALLEKFDEIWDPYKGLDNDTIKRIYSPTVLFIKNNKAFDKRAGTVESHTDGYVKLTVEQHKELQQAYTDIYHRYNHGSK
ncbi:MAG TPA: hypothetical protein VKZ57_16215 [Sphingobacterium sp.]|nr:hypothetical protein [Sphingobacterium sp.]